MSPRRDQLQQGSIVWAHVIDPRGNRKRRPIVVITRKDDIILNEPIVGVAVTTTFPSPPPDECVELPFDPRRRHPATGLAERSAAVCNWLVQIRPSDVTDIRGYVPTKALERIIRRVAEINKS